MFDAPMDGPVLWIALGVVSCVAASVAIGLPSTAPPDAAGTADAIDRVATSPYGATATVPVGADEIRLGPTQLSLRENGHASHATFAAGAVVPAGDALAPVLRGGRPQDVFESKRAFEAALDGRPAARGSWREAPDRLRVRRVTWGDVDATLVG